MSGAFNEMAGGLKQMQQAMNKLNVEADKNRSNAAAQLAELKKPLVAEIVALKDQVASLEKRLSSAEAAVAAMGAEAAAVGAEIVELKKEVAASEKAKILAVQKKRDEIIKLLNLYAPSSKLGLFCYVEWRVRAAECIYLNAPKLLLAAMLDDFAKVQELFDGGMDFGETFEPCESVATVVAEAGSVGMLKFIVEAQPSILDRDAEVSLLYMSVYAGNFINTKLLIDLGASADSICVGCDGNTPVHAIQASEKWLAFLKLLSKASGFVAALKTLNVYGETPFDLADAEGKKWLQENGYC